MRRISLLFIILLTACVVFLGYTVKQQEGQKEVRVFIAKDNLEEGTILTKNDIGSISINAKNNLSIYITKLSDIEGKKLINSVGKYELITTNNLIPKDEKNIRDTYLTVSAINNISNLKVGDKVVIYRRDVKNRNQKVGESPKLEELMRDKVIVAIPTQGKTTLKDIIVKATEEETNKYLKEQQNSEILVMKID